MNRRSNCHTGEATVILSVLCVILSEVEESTSDRRCRCAPGAASPCSPRCSGGHPPPSYRRKPVPRGEGPRQYRGHASPKSALASMNSAPGGPPRRHPIFMTSYGLNAGHSHSGKGRTGEATSERSRGKSKNLRPTGSNTLSLDPQTLRPKS